MTLKHAALCLLLLAVPACHKADPAEKAVQMMEDIGAAADAAGGDCTKLATSITSIADKYKSDLPAIKELATKQDKNAKQAMQEKYGDRLMKAAPKLMKMLACADDATFKQAMAPIDWMGR